MYVSVCASMCISGSKAQNNFQLLEAPIGRLFVQGAILYSSRLC